MSNDMKLIMESWKKLTKQTIKEASEPVLQEEDPEGEIYQGDLDLMGDPLSPEEKAKSDKSYEKKMKLRPIIDELVEQGYSLEQIRQIINDKEAEH
jgi:hypothetical protein